MVDVSTVLVGIALYQARPKAGSSMLYSSQDNFLSFGFKVSITELDVFLYTVSDGQKKALESRILQFILYVQLGCQVLSSPNPVEINKKFMKS